MPITLLSVDGTSTSCVYSVGKCDDGEQTLDMTQALGMAPNLASLVMFIGNTDTAIISAMTTHTPLSTTIGCSWGWRPADPTTLDPYFKRMAAQGQTFFVASGDSSTWTAGKYVWPADDPYIVSVGGTDLVTAAAGGAWQSETAWADSGGVSPDSIAIPAWQKLSRRHQLQQPRVDDAAQRAGRFGERELYLLYLRRPDCVPGELLGRNQLRRAHVGRLRRAGESTARVAGQRWRRFH